MDCMLGLEGGWMRTNLIVRVSGQNPRLTPLQEPLGNVRHAALNKTEL